MKESTGGVLRPAILIVGGAKFELLPRAQGGFRAQRVTLSAREQRVDEERAHPAGEMESNTNPLESGVEESGGEASAFCAVGHRGVAEAASFAPQR